MPDSAERTEHNVYILKTGAPGKARLRLLDEVYGAATRETLLEAGLAPGMKVLDVGCGIGTVSCWIARQVGREGAVLGIDLNDDQLMEAKIEAGHCDVLPIARFERVSAYETGLAPESFDLAFCRFLLCHLAAPQDAIAEMYRLLKPGGTIVCQDLDILSLYSSPPGRAFPRFVELARQAAEIYGVDYTFGRKLHTALLRAGFGAPRVRLYQPAHLKGDGKRLWEQTFLEASTAMIRLGITTQSEVDEMAREMDALALNEEVLIAQACLPSAIAVKPHSAN